MKRILSLIVFLFAASNFLNAQAKLPSVSSTFNKEEQELIDLSKKKWNWMSEKKSDSLSVLFNDKSVFVHKGGSWGKEQEVNIIKSGGIWYKHAEIYGTAVNIIGNTAIILTDIDLVAMLGQNEVINPFMVTEVYVKDNGAWKLGSLTFSQLMREVKLKSATNK